MRRLQNLIPAGAAFIAWVVEPYHLDFRRNQVWDVDPAGLATYWAHMPATVSYLMWERPESWQRFRSYREGWNERLIATRVLAYANAFDAALQRATILYRDDRFVIAHLPDRGVDLKITPDSR